MTKKHKVRWHDCAEAPEDMCNESHGFEDAMEDDKSSVFDSKLSTDDLDQSHPERRKTLKRSCRKEHLVTASACLTLAAAQNAFPIFDSGCNPFQLESSNNKVNDPFNKNNKYHILETYIEASPNELSHEAFIRKMQLQYFDAIEDLNSDD